MITLALAAAAGYGVLLLYTALALGWRGLGPGPARAAEPGTRVPFAARWAQLDLGVSPRELALPTAGAAALAGLVAAVLFGGPLPTVAAALLGAGWVPATLRGRRRRARLVAAEAWPRMIDELRVLTSSLGRSIPQALFEVGQRAPAELRPAFDAAHREWLLTTDFARTLAVLKAGLGDAAADATCETLLVAHEVGGAGLDRRLEALAQDRLADVQARKDALARQSGVRFARRFVLLVPLGMAAAGLSIGTGREAFRTPLGQLAATLAIALVVACWAWAGTYLRLPQEERVLSR